jgi:2-dehydropantoate 2-reductase
MPSGSQSPSTPSWTLLGCGALGGVFAALLTQSGQPTQVLLRERHRATLHPVIDFTGLDGQHGLISIARGFLADTPPIRRLLVMTKADQVIPALQPLIGKLDKRVPIVLLHNGMGVAERVAELFADNPIIAGVTSHGALQQGHFVFRHTGRGETWLGPINEQGRQFAHLADRLAQALGQAGWDEQILARQWHKLAINCAINPLTALYRIKNGELTGPRFADTLQQICIEVADVMNAEGIATTHEELARRVQSVAGLTADNYSSMQQDLEQGKETEIEAITGFLLAKARLHGIMVPVNQGLYQAVKDRHQGES